MSNKNDTATSYNFPELASRTNLATGSPTAKCSTILTEVATQYRQAAAAGDMDAIRTLTNNLERAIMPLSDSIVGQPTGQHAGGGGA